MTIYMAVTPDELELPLLVGTIEEIAKALNISKNTIYSKVWKKCNGKASGYKLVKAILSEEDKRDIEEDINADVRGILERIDRAIQHRKDLEKAKEIERLVLSGLSFNAALIKVTRKYKNAPCTTDQSKSKEHNKTFNDIIPPHTDLDNGILYKIANGETIKEL